MKKYHIKRTKLHLTKKNSTNLHKLTNYYCTVYHQYISTPQCKASISGVSVSVGDSNILPSTKVRDLGVIVDE